MTRVTVGAAVGFVVLVLANAIATADIPQIAILLGGFVGLVLVLYSLTTALLLWLALGPTLSGWISFSLLGPLPAITPDRAVLLLLLGLLTVRVLRRSVRLTAPGRIEIAMVLFVAIASVSLISTGGTWRTISEGGLGLDFTYLLQGYAIPFLGFYLAKNLLWKTRHIEWVLWTLILVGFTEAAMGVFQYFTGASWFAPTRFRAVHTGRAMGSLGSAVEFGMIVNASLVAAIVMLLRHRPPLTRFALVGVLGFNVVAVVLAKTRSIWVALLISLIILAAYERRFRKPLAVLIIFGGVSAAIAFPIVRETDFYKYRVAELSPIYNRIVLYATAANMIAHHPILGVGFGRFSFAERKWPYIVNVGHVSQRYAYKPGIPHNEYLHLLALLGIVGFAPYVCILLWSWRSASTVCRLHARTDSPAREITLVALGVLGVYAACAMFTDLISSPHATTQAFFLLGAVDGIRLRSERSPMRPRADLRARAEAGPRLAPKLAPSTNASQHAPHP